LSRPIARLVVAGALLLLGIVAAVRLPLRHLPTASFPELSLSLTLPESTDVDAVGREWARPLESAVRSLGDVLGMSGWVSARSVRLQVRFAPGTDPLRKAARLESELVPLRRRLGEGALGGSLRVSPASQAEGDLLAVLWVARADPAAAGALLEALRGIPGVRGVDPAGHRREELRIRLRPQSLSAGNAREAVAEAIEGWLGRRALGTVPTGEWRLPLVAGLGPPPAPGGAARGAPGWEPWLNQLAALPVALEGSPSGSSGVVPLDSLAQLAVVGGESDWSARLRGVPGLVVWVRRDPGASPLTVDRALRRTIATAPLPVEMGWSEADPIRALLRRLALGALLASTLAAGAGLGLGGFSRRGVLAALALAATLPLAAAVAANALWLAGLGLDVLSLPAACAGLAAVFPLAALRLTAAPSRPGLPIVLSGLSGALALPVVVALVGGELGPLLAAPARAFALALAATLPVLYLLPAGWARGVRHAPHHGHRGRAGLRGILRDPGTVLLVAATAGCIALTLFGAALEPESGALRGAPGDLTVELQLPEGATRAETGRRLARAEAVLEDLPEVENYWAYYRPGAATLQLDLHRWARRPDRQGPFRSALAYRLSGAGATALIQGGNEGQGAELRFANDLEERAETDEEARFYRVVLRAAEAETLRRTFDRLRDRIVLTAGLRTGHIHADWGGTGVRVTLEPRPGVSPGEAAELAALLAERSRPPRRWELPGTRDQAVVLEVPGYPRDADTVPRQEDLLHQPLGFVAAGSQRSPVRGGVPATWVERQEELLLNGVARESGRYVLPVTVSLPFHGDQLREERRAAVDRALAALPLPPGTDLERPSLEPFQWRRERWHMIALAAALPLLLWALGAFRLNSLAAGLASLLPATLGVAAAATLIWFGPGRVDEMALFLLAATVCAVQPAILEIAGLAGNPDADFPPFSKGGPSENPPPPPPLRKEGRPHPSHGNPGSDFPPFSKGGPRGDFCLGSDFPPFSKGGVLPGRLGDFSRPRNLYRLWATPLPWIAALIPAVVVLLAGPTPWAEAGRQPWETPLRAAALAAGMALLAAVTALPALLHIGLLVRHRDPEAERRRRHPIPWREPALSASPPTLAVRRLTKEYGKKSGERDQTVRALSAVSFQLEPGIVGLLGPNGAGKTTLLRILTGLLEPTRGQVLYRGARVLPENRSHYRRAIGFLPQEFNAYDQLTVEGFLDYWALERGLHDSRQRRREIEQLLETVDLAEHAGRRVRDLSGGMRQRAGIARALLGSPPILIVDEPTTGLDIESRDAFRRTLLAAAGERIVLFSTHIASDVDAAASRILLLHRGRLRFDGTPGELIARAQGRVCTALLTDGELKDFSHRYRITARVRTLEGIRVRAVLPPDTEEVTGVLPGALPGKPVTPSLEEAYLAEIDRADQALGVEPRRDRFRFLDGLGDGLGEG